MLLVREHVCWEESVLTAVCSRDCFVLVFREVNNQDFFFRRSFVSVCCFVVGVCLSNDAALRELFSRENWLVVSLELANARCAKRKENKGE